jgi:hypothetical protein
MTALALLHHLHEQGVILTPSRDGTIHCRASKGILTPALLDAIHQHKQELLALLAQSAPANDAPATAPSAQATCIHQAHVPSAPPLYPGRPVGAPFRAGQRVWLYRWDDHTPRFDAPVTIVEIRTLSPGEQDIRWRNAAGEVTWHNARLAVAVETQERRTSSQAGTQE